MGVNLLKITNAGIKITDSMVIPVIKAVVNVESTPTEVEMRELYQQIYDYAGGMISVVSVSARDGVDFSSIPSSTYGNNEDFKFEISISNSRYCYYNRLSFNNILVSQPFTYTGYAYYETDYMVIFVDENNYIFNITNTPQSGIYALYSTNPGYSIQNDEYIIASVVPDFSLFTGGQWGIIGTIIGNIGDYIVWETDPTNTDPYVPGGESTIGGGEGDFDGTSDSIDFPSLPTLSASDTGFITLFNPTITQLKNLASYMWSNPLFDISAWKKIFADPMDAILGLSIVPVAVPNGGTSTVKVGNISTDINMTIAGTQYVEVDCGTLNVNEYWGAYLDYAPYTKAEIFLPYIGIHPLSVDDVMNKAVHVKYHVDILSGACTAYVKCGNSIIYSYIGQCSSSVPISGNDWTNVINGVLSIAGSIGTMVATGGASAPMAVGIASTAVNQMKPEVQKSGGMSGTGGLLAIQKPYIILTRPRQALPTNQNHYMGYPAFITSPFSALNGYTEVESVHLENIPCTSEELSEIESLLKGGVLF